MEQLAASNAYEAVFARLDSGFRYDPLTELPDDFEQFFVRLQRKQGQTLQDYMTDFTKAERRLKISHSVELPENKVKAWWFLRRSGITREQRQLILMNVGIQGLAMDEVMKAMSPILGQDSKTDGQHPRRAKNKSDAYYYYDHELETEWHDDQDSRQLPVFYEADESAEDDASWFDDGQDYYEDDKAETVFDVGEYDEVYATCQDAQARLNALRTSRGFYPVVAALDSQAKIVSTAKRNRPRREQGFWQGQGTQPDSAMGKALCLRCWAKNCPQSADKKRRLDEPSQSDVNMVMDEAFKMDEGDESDMESDDKAVQDGGAASVLGSRRAVRRYLRYLLEKGYDIHSIDLYQCQKTFTYGNSQRETTDRCLLLPAFFGGCRIDILSYIIGGEAPLLFGRLLLEKLGLTMGYKNKRMKWADGDWEAVETGKRGGHLLRLGKNLAENMQAEPTQVLLPHDFDDHEGQG